MLKFRIEGQKLTWENPDEVVVAGTKKYLECYFEFDGDAWSGFEYIEAFFKNGRDKPIRMLLSANRIWKEDRLCLSAGDWSVYLRAMVSKKKLDEEGNVVYEEDGVTPVMELEKQMTSSSVSIRVLAHGQFENAQNSFESPEIAEQYIEQMLDIGNAMAVFEEYDPEKEYFKHNRVAFEGASYVLIAESVQGINPTDTESWLCIAEKGDKGDKGDNGESTKIIAYALGLGKDVAVGYNAVMPDELYGRVKHLDLVIDTEGNCIFQYKAYEGDEEGSMPAESFRCIANPNPESGGLAGEGCVMKFMKEVSALPEAANDGEVYSVSPWESVGAYDGSGTEFYDNNASFVGWNALGNALYQDIQYHYAWTYKFVLSNGTEVVYKECGISSAGEWGFDMVGYCTDSNINLTLTNGEIVDVYRINGEPKDNVSYVRFNGKWIKL